MGSPPIGGGLCHHVDRCGQFFQAGPTFASEKNGRRSLHHAEPLTTSSDSWWLIWTIGAKHQTALSIRFIHAYHLGYLVSSDRGKTFEWTCKPNVPALGIRLALSKDAKLSFDSLGNLLAVSRFGEADVFHEHNECSDSEDPIQSFLHRLVSPIGTTGFNSV